MPWDFRTAVERLVVATVRLKRLKTHMVDHCMFLTHLPTKQDLSTEQIGFFSRAIAIFNPAHK
jgi:hypothetical protein